MSVETPVITIVPRSGFGGFRLPEIWESRFLLARLAKRDLTLRYRQTALGVVWVVLQPLMAAGVLSFVFGKVAKLPDEGVPYYALTMSGYVGWSCFSTIISKASGSILANAGMISKVFFPRLLLPLSTVLSTMVDVSVAVVLLLGTLVISGVGLSAKLIFLIPFLIGFALLALGIGAATAALAVPYRDINYVLPVVLQLLLYASPVAYGLSNVPSSVMGYMNFNPLVGLLEGMRWCCLPGRDFPTASIVRSVIGGTIILIVGLIIFERVERDFADVI